MPMNAFEWIDIWTDPTLVFSENGALEYTNKSAQLFFSESELERAAGVFEVISNAAEHLPISWEVQPGKHHFSVHSGKVGAHFYAVFKDVRDTDELVAALNYNKLLYSGLANGTIEGLVLIHQGKAVDSNVQAWKIMGVSSSAELVKIDWESQLGPREWKRMLTRPDEVIDFEFTNCLGQNVVVEGKLSVVDSTQQFHALALLDITERRKISKDLLQTKERFRLLVETNPFGLFLVVQGQVRYTNQAGMEMLGLSDEEDIFEQPILSFFEESDRFPIQEDLDHILLGNKTAYKEVVMLKSDGKKKEVGLQMVLSFFDNQPAVQITVNDLSTRMQLVREQMRRSAAEESNLLLTEEIEQHRKTQRQLQEAERFNRSIIESSIDMIMAFDVHGKIIQFNHAASVEFGMTATDAMELKASDFLANQEDYNQVVQDLRNQRYYAGELAGRRSTGEVFQMLISIAALPEVERGDAGFVLVGRDITDLRLAEQELRRSEERYRDILENASDLVFLVNSKGYVEYANPAFFNTLGYPAKSLRVTPIYQLIQWSDAESQENWMEVLAGDRNELTFRNESGQAIKVLGGGSVQQNEKGEITGLRCIYLNVSEMRAYQRDAKVKSAKLESIFNSTRYLLMFTIDKSFRVTSVNQNLKRVLKEQFGFETILGS
ncbi:MAG: PAS domain S-box protein, partial [Flavobacteriales bacterium]